MGMGMVYLVMGLALVGGIFWTLTQVTARQRRLQDELTRLERLASEVAMNADAILDRVDDRAQRLQGLLVRVEAAAAAIGTPAATPAAGPAAAPAATPAVDSAVDLAAEPAPKPKKRGGGRKKAQAPAEPIAETSALQAPQPPSIERYQVLRTRVLELSEAGKDPGEIAQLVGVPRGEVQLILNLQSRKVTA